MSTDAKVLAAVDKLVSERMQETRDELIGLRGVRVPLVGVSWQKIRDPDLGELWEATATSYDRLTGIVPDYCALPAVTAKEVSRDRNRAIGFALESLAKALIASSYQRDPTAPSFSPTAGGETHGAD